LRFYDARVILAQVSWTVILLEEVEEWFFDLDQETAELLGDAVDQLERKGPTLARPLADRVKGSRLHNLKELRPGSTGHSEVRVLFCFDPARRAILLVAGDKAGQWQDWYKRAIPLAEERYARWLAGEYDEEG
jgi:hypothetical protein